MTDVRGFDAEIARRLDLPKAIILQQLAFRTSKGYGVKVTDRDGTTRWLHKTFKELHEEEFPWWSVRTIKAHFKELTELGLIESTKLGSQPFYHSRAWRVVREHEFWSDKPTYDSAEIAPSESAEIAPSDSADIALPSSTKPLKQEETTPPTNVVEDIVKLANAIDREEEILIATAKPGHGPTVARFWQKMMVYHKKAAGFQAQVGQGEQKMLKVLFAALGADGPKTLDHALANWSLFQAFTRDNYDIKLTVKPQIKGLAQCRDPLAEFAQLKADAHGDDDPYAGLATSVADFEE